MEGNLTVSEQLLLWLFPPQKENVGGGDISLPGTTRPVQPPSRPSVPTSRSSLLEVNGGAQGGCGEVGVGESEVGARGQVPWRSSVPAGAVSR